MFVDLDGDIGLVARGSDQTQDFEPGLYDDGSEPHVLPSDLETITPGPFLAAVVSAVDPARLSGADVVYYVQAQERLVSHYQAAYYTGVAELAHATDPDTTDRDTAPGVYASDELQAALAKTRRSADADVDLALDLRIRIPQVWEALKKGQIDISRARVFCNELTTLESDLIPALIEPLLQEAGDLTTGQLRARLKRSVIEADLQAAENHHQRGLEDRKVSVYPNPDHTANILIGNITPQDAIEISENLHTQALQLKRLPGETRTLQQVMADLATDRLKTTTTSSSSPTIQPELVVHLKPGDPTARVPGYGPILPQNLDQLLQRAATITITTQTSTSISISEDNPGTECHQTTSRQPTKTQIQHVQNRYPTCIFMGCRMPAERCDLDHRQPYAQGGKTTCTNLAPLCRHHHNCKHQGRWKLQRNPDGGHTWTSPLGHTYTTRAPP